MTTVLTFQSTHFDIIEQNSQVWLTAPQIGMALGYKADDAISRIYRRNSEEFTSVMTETVKLTVSGNYQKTVRIFSLRGAHLIAMFSRTSIAKQFRRWVLDVLDKETQTLVPIKPKAPIVSNVHNGWPTVFQSGKNSALFQFFNQTAHYITFEIFPHNQTFKARFSFFDSSYQVFYTSNELGDLGYFESNDIEELWRQVIRFCGRCNSQCAFF